MSGGIAGAAEAEDVLSQALVWILDNDLDRAEVALRELAQRNSDRAILHLALARVYRRRGEIGRAIQLHQNLLLREGLSKTERRQAKRGLAEDFRSGGFLRRAEAAYEELLAEDSKDPVALGGLLRVLEDRGELRRVIDVAGRLRRVSGDRSAWAQAQQWCALAKAEHAQGRSVEARKALGRALRADPDHGASWLLLGELEAERGRTRKALTAWRRAAERDPASAAEAYPKIEATNAALGRPRDTEQLLRRALEEKAGDEDALLALCHLLEARGDAREALDLLEKERGVDVAPLALASLRCRLLLAEEDTGARPALETLLDRIDRDLVS
jgi:lipopolysaccharide biosynthesis regulator YciM